VKESELLAIKYTLGDLGLLNLSESLIRFFSPAGKRFRAHRREMISFYSQFVNSGDLCFDVGANLGSRVDVFLACGARVVAVEPQENCIRYLRLKYGKNRNVILIDKGLGDAEGEAELFISSEDSATSSMSADRITRVSSARHLARERWDRTRAIRLTTIDKLVALYGQPVFCKIDVEGFEYQVLKGLSSPIKALSFEYTPEYMESTLNCIRHLATLGSFTFNYSPAESMIFALLTWVGSNEILGVMNSIPTQEPCGDVYARLLGNH
jgi:FkbM family methyltransferase